MSARRLRNRPISSINSIAINNSKSSTIGSDFNLKNIKNPFSPLTKTPNHNSQNYIQYNPRSCSTPRSFFSERNQNPNSLKLLKGNSSNEEGMAATKQIYHSPRIFNIESRTDKTMPNQKANNFNDFRLYHKIMKKMDEKEKIQAHRRYQQQNQRCRVSKRLPDNEFLPSIFPSPISNNSRVTKCSTLRVNSPNSPRFNFMISSPKYMNERSSKFIIKYLPNMNNYHKGDETTTKVKKCYQD